MREGGQGGESLGWGTQDLCAPTPRMWDDHLGVQTGSRSREGTLFVTWRCGPHRTALPPAEVNAATLPAPVALVLLNHATVRNRSCFLQDVLTGNTR